MKKLLSICLMLCAMGAVWTVHERIGHAQVSSQTMPVSTAVTAYRPVVTVNGVSVAPQTGTAPGYGIAAASGAAGSTIDVVKYGDYPCEFDAPPTPGNTATYLNGKCHDSGFVTDGQICNTVGIGGKIMKPLPAMGPNFFEITIGFPGRKGSMVCAASFDPSTVAAVATSGSYNDLSNKPVIPSAPATLTGLRYGNGASPDTAATSAQVQTLLAGAYDASGAAAARAGVGSCGAGLYAVATTTAGVSCAQVSYSQLSSPPSLATVATTGSYNDLTGKPTINSGTVTSVSSNISGATWLTVAVATNTTTPVLNFTVTAIPNSALANPATTPNGVTCTLGSTCTVYPPLTCSVTISGTTLVALLASVQTTTATCTGVVSGGSYFVAPSAAPTSGFGILAGAYGSATNTLTVFFYQPSVALGTAYSIPVKVIREQ